MILAQAASRAEIDRIVQEDPFYTAGVAAYEVIQFHPTMAAAPLAAFTEPQ